MARNHNVEGTPGGPSEATDEKGNVYAIHKLNESKEPQMGNHENLEKNQEQRLKQDFRNKVNIAVAYIEFKEDIIKVLLDFVFMWGGDLNRVNIAKLQIK